MHQHQLIFAKIITTTSSSFTNALLKCGIIINKYLFTISSLTFYFSLNRNILRLYASFDFVNCKQLNEKIQRSLWKRAWLAEWIFHFVMIRSHSVTHAHHHSAHQIFSFDCFPSTGTDVGRFCFRSTTKTARKSKQLFGRVTVLCVFDLTTMRNRWFSQTLSFFCLQSSEMVELVEAVYCSSIMI